MNLFHYLKLNPSKTELLDIPGDASLCHDLIILLENSLITTWQHTKLWYIYIDNLTQSWIFLLYKIKKICSLLSSETMHLLVHTQTCALRYQQLIQSPDSQKWTPSYLKSLIKLCTTFSLGHKHKRTTLLAQLNQLSPTRKHASGLFHWLFKQLSQYLPSSKDWSSTFSLST